MLDLRLPRTALRSRSCSLPGNYSPGCAFGCYRDPSSASPSSSWRIQQLLLLPLLFRLLSWLEAAGSCCPGLNTRCPAAFGETDSSARAHPHISLSLHPGDSPATSPPPARVSRPTLAT
ncbi:uncharacterized protein ACBT57_025574 [Dama dama]